VPAPVITFPQHVYIPNYGLNSSITYRAGIPPNSSWRPDEFGPNTSIIDSNTVKALEDLICGEVSLWSTLETAEMAVRALILHENVYWMFPAALIVKPEKVYGGNNTIIAEEQGEIIYPKYQNSCAILDFLRQARVSSYSVYGGGVFVEKGIPIYGSDFWIKNFALLSRKDNDLWNVFQDSLAEPNLQYSYFLSPKAIGAASYLGSRQDRELEAHVNEVLNPKLPERILSLLDDSWASEVQGSNIGLNILLGPFLAMVLSRANDRNDIQKAIIELRDEFADARKELWGIWEAPLHEARAKVAIREIRKLESAMKSIIPAAFPRKERSFSFGWNAAHAVYDLIQTGGVMSGVKLAGELLLGKDLAMSQVSTIGLTRGITENLMATDQSLPGLLRKHLSESETRSLGL